MVDAAKLPQAPPDRKVQSIESVDAPSALGGVGIPLARQSESPARSLLPERPIHVLRMQAICLCFGAKSVRAGRASRRFCRASPPELATATPGHVFGPQRKCVPGCDLV